MVRINARALSLTAALLITPAVASCGYNTIPTKEERAQAAWADVQSQYQRRADLVPTLVATVQGAAIQERTTLTDVINARARATSVNVSADSLSDPAAFQQYQQAQGELSGALSRLLVSVEAYPQLQANQNFVSKVCVTTASVVIGAMAGSKTAAYTDSIIDNFKQRLDGEIEEAKEQEKR